MAESDLLVQCPHEEPRQRDALPPVLAGMCMFRMPVTRRYLELFESSGSECSAALVVSSPSSDSSSPSSPSSLSEPDSSLSDSSSSSYSFRLARASYTAALAASLARMSSRWSFSSSGSAPLLSAAARVAQPASVI